MPGSNTPIPFVLVYDCIYDKSLWRIPSVARHLENIAPHQYEVIDEHDPMYSVYQLTAGDKPKVYHQEVQQIKQGDSDEKKEA